VFIIRFLSFDTKDEFNDPIIVFRLRCMAVLEYRYCSSIYGFDFL